MINLLAPAKINLYLHIVGRRNDGYHLLDSLFVYTNFGDRISIGPAETISVSITGPFQSQITIAPEKTLMHRAATLLKTQYAVKQGAHIQVEKNIPVGAGLGGGSSDAATTLNALTDLWGLTIDPHTLATLGLTLGADIPACLHQKPARISGIGEKIDSFLPTFSRLPILLIKPPESLSTPTVFAQYAAFNTPFSTPLAQLNSAILPTFIEQLHHAHNDLETAAINLYPEIHDILKALKAQMGCVLSRMSGSGSACFALFKDTMMLQAAKKNMATQFPDYWIQETTIF